MQYPSVVLIHSGSRLPHWLPHCLRQIRRWFSGDVYLGLHNTSKKFIKVKYDSFQIYIPAILIYKKYNINFLNIKNINDADCNDGLQLANSLKVYGDLEHRAMVRLFVLEYIIKKMKLTGVIHMESDVMIYFDPNKKTWPHKGVYINPVSDEFATWAFTYIATIEDLQIVNNYQRNLLRNGVTYLEKKFQSNTVNEMLLAGDILRENIALPLPTLPADGVDMLFDGSAYGQFVGGTGADPPGFLARGRYVGEAFLEKKISMSWRTDELRRKYPLCRNIVDGSEIRIGNLHMHSKRLLDFAS
jgi:hypothetical protein